MAEFSGRSGKTSTKGCMSREVLVIIILVICVPFTTPSPTSSLPNVEGCKDFQDDYSPTSTPHTQGKIWQSKTVVSQDTPKCPDGFSKPPLILISLDGFRAEYLERGLTPNLEKLRRQGISTPYMRSAFPTRTFPNHYTIVTGLYPESHGIIDNFFYDIELEDLFIFSRDVADDPKWWHGEPIWNTAQRAGLRSHTMFWPGSEVNISGSFPDVCFKFNQSVPYDQRVQRIFSWLDLPEGERPDFITFYMGQPDTAGHAQGPDGPWVTGNITRVDKVIGDLMDGLIERRLDSCINIMITSDHGMAPMSCDRVVDISDSLMNNMQLNIFDGSFVRISSRFYADNQLNIFINPNGIPPAEIVDKLECRNFNTSMDFYTKVYLKGDLPVRNHYVISPRIEDVIMTVTEEWLVKGLRPLRRCDGGAHGYDNLYESMQGIFIAFGNSFRNTEVEEFESIELYNLMTDVLGIPGVSNNGTYGRMHHLLRYPPGGSRFVLPPGSSYTQAVYPALAMQRAERRAASDCNCTNGAVDLDVLDEELNLSSADKVQSFTKHLATGRPIITASLLKVWELVQTDYINAYSVNHKMALWSAFSLNTESSNDSLSLDASCTRVDVRLPPSDAAPCRDYTGGDVSASYLLPPAWATSSPQDATISSNIVPMYSTFRDGVWKYTLELLREYKNRYKNIWVMAGPVFDNDPDGLHDSINTINSFVPGSLIPLPTHYFLILTRCNDSSLTSINNCPHPETMALIIPHKPEPGNCWDANEERMMDYLQTHVARVRDIELITGLQFYPNVSPKQRQLVMRTHLQVGLWT